MEHCPPTSVNPQTILGTDSWGEGPEERLRQCLSSLSWPRVSLQLSGACDRLSLRPALLSGFSPGQGGSRSHPAGTRSEFLGLGGEKDC